MDFALIFFTYCAYGVRYASLCTYAYLVLSVFFTDGYISSSHIPKKEKMCQKTHRKQPKRQMINSWCDALLRTRWLLVPAPLLRLPCCASLLLQPVMKPLLFNLQTRQLVSHVQGDFSSVSVWIILLIFYCWSSRALLPAERWKQWGLPVNRNFYWLQPSSLR